MAQVFVSYKSEDRERVRPIVRALQCRGVSVWWDQRIGIGAAWHSVIKRALDRSQAVLGVWTDQSIRDNGTFASLPMASEVLGAVSGERPRLVPVQMQGSRRPFILDQIQALDLRDWGGHEEELQLDRLVSGIFDLIGEPPPRPIDHEELTAWLAAEDANHADAFREFLRAHPLSHFAADAEPRASEIDQVVADIELAADAAQRITRHLGVEVRKPEFTVPLAVDEAPDAGNRTTLQPPELYARLVDGAKMVVMAEPGGGKTITLLDWAHGYCDALNKRVGVCIRLPDIGNSEDFFAHLEYLDVINGIKADAWKALAQSGVLTIFCDGWNELNQKDRERLGRTLNVHARNYPASGLVIGSRPLAPRPLVGPHVVLELQRLSFQQVRSIVDRELGGDAAGAIAELRSSEELAELVRTPFFLHAFCASRLMKTTPTTRDGLVRGFLASFERTPEHATALREGLSLQHTKYLRAIAVEMIKSDEPRLSVDAVFQAINAESHRLINEKILEASPRPLDVIGILRDHHCLVEHSGDEPAFRFQHQLIQEWYATDEVVELAVNALVEDQANRRLCAELLDQTRWTEPVKFAMERLRNGNVNIHAAAHIILRCLGIQPRFAATLISLASPAVWEKVRHPVERFLKEWKPVAGERFVSFVVRAGREELAHHVWDAITAEDNKRGSGLHVTRIQNPIVLGRDWRTRLKKLRAETRSSVLYVLAYSGRLECARIAVDAALEDSSAKVQATVAEGVHFYGHVAELCRLLDGAKPKTWELLVQTQHLEQQLTGPYRKNAVRAAKRLVKRLAPGSQRLHTALWLKSLGENPKLDLVEELFCANFEYAENAERAFDAVAKHEGPRLSQVIIERALSGVALPYRAERYVNREIIIDQSQVLATLKTKRDRHRDLATLAPLLTQATLTTLLREYFSLAEHWRANRSWTPPSLSDEYRNAEDSLSYADGDRLVAAILCANVTSPSEIASACRVIALRLRPDQRNQGELVSAELREELTTKLSEWSSALVNCPGTTRHDLHAAAEAISVLSSSRLLSPLRSLLEEDLRRLRAEKEEFSAIVKAGGRPPANTDARMSYAVRYARNLLSIANPRSADAEAMSPFPEQDSEKSPPQSYQATEAVVDVLMEFLDDPEFGPEAANAIALLYPDPIRSVGEQRSFVHLDLRAARQRKVTREQIGDGRLDAAAVRVLNAIKQIALEGSKEKHDLAVKLSLRAARMACGKRRSELSTIVLKHGGPDARLTYLVQMLLSGFDVPADAAEQCLNELDARRVYQRWEYHEQWSKWEDLLTLMICGGKPIEAASRLLRYDQPQKHNDERQIIEALGFSSSEANLAALRLLRPRCEARRLFDTWCSAAGAIGTLEAGHLLLDTLLDNSHGDDWYQKRSIEGLISKLALLHPALLSRIRAVAETDAPERAKLLAGVISGLRNEDALLTLLGIAKERISLFEDALSACLREVCVEYRPSEHMRGAFDVITLPVPRLRATLFAEANSASVAQPTFTRLMLEVDDIRGDFRSPSYGTRHPDISVGIPWPAAARDAWSSADAARHVSR